MLPRPQRLHQEAAFRAVGRFGRSAHGRFFSIRARANRLAHHRFGFIISRKTAKRAVDRNRLKRQLRHRVGALPKQTPSLDVVIIVRPTALTATTTALVQDLQQTFQRFTHVSPRRTTH